MLLAPVGHVIQDVVADAMTVEAVPQVGEKGHPVQPRKRRLMHTTMQTLGRIAIVLIKLTLLKGVEDTKETK